jgi:hypothetical protein
VVNWKGVGRVVKLIYEGKVVEDVLHNISSIDRALPRDVVAVILERLFNAYGCYVDRYRRYVLCDRPLGVRCRQRGRLHWCVVEPPWFFSEKPLPGCFKLNNGYLCLRKDVEVALKRFEEGDCGAAVAAMPGRRAETEKWVLYVSEGVVYECSRVVSIYRVRQECRVAERCGALWRVSKAAAIAYEIVNKTYVVWQKPADETLKEIYLEEGGGYGLP